MTMMPGSSIMDSLESLVVKSRQWIHRNESFSKSVSVEWASELFNPTLFGLFSKNE